MKFIAWKKSFCATAFYSLETHALGGHAGTGALLVVFSHIFTAYLLCLTVGVSTEYYITGMGFNGATPAP